AAGCRADRKQQDPRRGGTGGRSCCRTCGVRRSTRSGQLWTDQVLSVPVSPNASVSTMQSVHVPDESPVSPGTARPVKLKLQAPFGNVPVGNAATVAPLCASVPRRIEQKS